MFEISRKKFCQDDYGHEDYLDNWPMLYLLEGNQDRDKKIYIGQSNRINSRMSEHKRNYEKSFAEIVHMIYSEEFNLSVVYDYESKLIQYIFADHGYIVTNGNKGMINRNYYKKQYYEQMFYELWGELQKKKIVKKDIKDILNSDYFKYSPYKELSYEQSKSVEKILNCLKKNDRNTLMVKGMPGSGKTIICTFLMKYLKELEEFKEKRIALVIPQDSLRETLKRLFSKIDGMDRGDVIGPYDVIKKEYDILIVDEAHRLTKRKNIINYKQFDIVNKSIGLSHEGDQMDWILKSSKSQVFFYDALQVIGPAGVEYEKVNQKLAMCQRLSSYVGKYNLYSQMRVQGGRSYIDYVVALLRGDVAEKKYVKNYEFKIINDFARFNDLLYKKENQNQLCRMAAGFAWEWISKKDKSRYDIEISGIKKQWNHTRKHWIHQSGSIDQVGCIHSVQGYDLNYAFIILGEDIKYVDGKIVADSSNYYDVNGKKTTNNDTLIEYIRNVYYVLMTRGIKGTYLYICDDELRNYFKKYVEVEEKI